MTDSTARAAAEKKLETELGFKACRDDEGGIDFTDEHGGVGFTRGQTKYVGRVWNHALSLTERLATVEAENRWVSVEERLPERTDSPINGRAMVIVVVEGDGFDSYVAPASFELGEFQWLGGGELKGIRKWRPLPSPPSDGKE